MKRLTAGLVVAILVIACGGGETGGGGGGGGGGETAAQPLGTASVGGTVSFTGTPPANPKIDMSEEPDCAAKHAGGATDPRVVVTNGKLANVVVYVKSGLPAGATPPRPATPATIDQTGCLYTPRVVAVMAGQDLEIKNSDPLLHNIKAVPSTNRGFNISQPREGMTSTRVFAMAEVTVPFECNVHGWMKGYVAVVDNPYFAVTGPGGSFSIRGLPAGTYALEAWHEVFGTKTITVTVAEGGTATGEFTFTAS